MIQAYDIERVIDDLRELLDLHLRNDGKNPEEGVKRAIIHVRRAIDSLEHHDCEDAAEWYEPDYAGAIECLQLGLPILEAKYGHSSGEAQTARSIIAEYEQKPPTKSTPSTK